MKVSNLDTFELLSLKFDCKQEYLSSLDSDVLEKYKQLNKELYGYSSFRDIPQQLLDALKKHSARYTEDFDSAMSATLTENLQFSSSF